MFAIVQSWEKPIQTGKHLIFPFNCRYLFTVKLCLLNISFIGPHNSFIHNPDTFNSREAIVYETVTPVNQKVTSPLPLREHSTTMTLFEKEHIESSTTVHSAIHSQ